MKGRIGTHEEIFGAGMNDQRMLTTLSQVVLSPVFLVSLEEEPTALVRLPSVTCADPAACSRPPRSGESGTRRSTWDRSTFVTTSLETTAQIIPPYSY